MVFFILMGCNFTWDCINWLRCYWDFAYGHGNLLSYKMKGLYSCPWMKWERNNLRGEKKTPLFGRCMQMFRTIRSSSRLIDSQAWRIGLCSILWGSRRLSCLEHARTARVKGSRRANEYIDLKKKAGVSLAFRDQRENIGQVASRRNALGKNSETACLSSRCSGITTLMIIRAGKECLWLS